MRTLKVLIDGLAFAEGPRWRDGKLFFSDMHAHQVLAVDMAGRRELICEVPERPSGLGWLPDGRMLVVSMRDRSLMRLDRDGLKTVADLSLLAVRLQRHGGRCARARLRRQPASPRPFFVAALAWTWYGRTALKSRPSGSSSSA